MNVFYYRKFEYIESHNFIDVLGLHLQQDETVDLVVNRLVNSIDGCKQDKVVDFE